jgi:DNA sulfur modification protein DndC
MRDEYLLPHGNPWIVGFSGGKDSTLLAHLVFETVLGVPFDLRKRPVWIVCNDTLVESPVFQGFVDKLLARVDDASGQLRVPIRVAKTSPLADESFWVNLLGRGYPAPNRSFRWCTDRMKIRPTSRFIREQVTNSGEAVLLLGVRKSESSARAANIARHELHGNGRLSPHSEHKGVWVYSPIKNLTTDEVWITLLSSQPPWGGTYHELSSLYKDAHGGECPFVMSSEDAPSCGTSSARFGCWTCTVIEKDSSLQNLVAAGHSRLSVLVEFRNRIRNISENPDCRSKIRRNGQPGLGPLTLETRKVLLAELLKVQDAVGQPLISDLEKRLIQEQWVRDSVEDTWREVEKANMQTSN